MNAPELCRHGCVGWCATCDWAAAHPEGLPRVEAELPGRAAVCCPRRGCGHALAQHKDGICTADGCACGLPEPRYASGDPDEIWEPPARKDSLPNRISGIAAEVEDEQPTIALMLRRALHVTKGRSW